MGVRTWIQEWPVYRQLTGNGMGPAEIGVLLALPLWVISPVLFTWVGRLIAARLARAGIAQQA